MKAKKPQPPKQKFLPSRSATRQLAAKRASVVDYAKAGPNVVRNGRSIAGPKP